MASDTLRIRVFFSHKYEAFAVNHYFYGLLTEDNHRVQFEVDEGRRDGKPLPSNVTRIERKIRDASAFIGVYPLPEDAVPEPEDPYLGEQSRYFRFELDIARRVGLPTIVFADRRYRTLLRPFPSVVHATFDSREFPEEVTTTAENDFRTAITSFYTDVEKRLFGIRRKIGEKRVGLILSTQDYEDAVVDRIEQSLTGWDVERLPWPPQLQAREYADLESFDWLLVDTGRSAARTGIVPYLHARAIPTMRVRRLPDEGHFERGEHEDTMYGGLEVGYADPRKEVSWDTPEALVEGLTAQLGLLKHPATLIASGEKAAQYFRRAADVNVRLFLSCSGADLEFAEALADQLKSRFQDAFYYKHPGDLTPGSAWMEEIAEKIESAQLGVILHSAAWLESGYCEYERDLMIRRRADHAMQVIPVKLTREEPDLHSTMKGITYVKPWDLEEDFERIADEIVDAYRKLAQRQDPGA